VKKRKALTVQRGVLRILVLAVLMVGLAGCCTEPKNLVTAPAGEIDMSVGKQIVIKASAEGADRYEWELHGGGNISSTEGQTILYTAPEESGMALVTVIAYNDECESPETSLTIRVPPLPTPTPSPVVGPVAIKPTQDTVLEDKDCPNGAAGEILAQGTISLSGLKPGQTYWLTLNGWKGVPPNDELCKIDCTSHGEGYWDFDKQVIADEDGRVSQRPLKAVLPFGVELFPDTTYKVKFFVKEGPGSFCTVLGHDEFWFTVEALQ